MVGCGEGTWTNLGPTGDLPSARSTSMVCDAASAKVILFGGHAMERYPDTACGDTWAYDPTANTWTNLHPAGSLPPVRWGAPMVYDPDADKVILFGGGDSGSTSLGDTWGYDLAANTGSSSTPAVTCRAPE